MSDDGTRMATPEEIMEWAKIRLRRETDPYQRAVLDEYANGDHLDDPRHERATEEAE